MPLDIKYPSMLLFTGTSQAGKSHLLRHLLIKELAAGRFKFGLVFTSTAFNQGFSFIPEKYVIPNFDIEILDNYLKVLEKAYGKKIKHNEAEGKPVNDGVPHSFIVFDDIVPLIKQKEPEFQHFLATFRHYNITVYVTAQQLQLIGTLWRQQVYYAFIFAQDRKNQLEWLYSAFNGRDCNNWKDFKAFLKESTYEQYRCLVYIRDELDDNKKWRTFKAPAKIPKANFVY